MNSSTQKSAVRSAAQSNTLLPARTIWSGDRITDRARTRIEFPDLIRFHDHWYCGFREGLTHNNHPSGRVRIIRSSDGVQWETVHVITWDCGDVREPKFSITAEGCLMMNSSVYFVSREPRSILPQRGAELSYTPPEARKKEDRADHYYQLDWLGTTLNLPDHDREPMVTQQSTTWLSRDGVNWSSAYACPNGINSWLWTTAWHAGMGYSVAEWGKDAQGTLYRTRDGKSWRALATNIFPEDHGGEASLAFDDAGDLIALLRGNSKSMVMLGRARGPYFQEWSWTLPDMDWAGDGNRRPVNQVMRVSMGGPKLLRLKDGRFVGSGRVLGPASDDGQVTLFWVDPAKNLFTRIAACDGTSYPGLFEFNGEVWITYISAACHQDRWEVQLAKCPIPAM